MDFTHEAVRLFIHCRKCGRDMDLTCEFSKSGKELRWGHYGKHLYRKGSKEFRQRLSYNSIRNVFDEMWQNGYDLIVRNCGDWAKDFYRRVCNLA
uniref:Uncharacterized protein n=1 Tax=Meloidogyne floridensis TaxID=298350 RepID=A0A915NT88_9BILA